MMDRKPKYEAKPRPVAQWMVTYGDMMTLLLTFFVLLLSFSTTEAAKFRQAMVSLKGVLGVGREIDSSILHPNSMIPVPGGLPTQKKNETSGQQDQSPAIIDEPVFDMDRTEAQIENFLFEADKYRMMDRTIDKMDALIKIIDSLNLSDEVKLLPDVNGVTIRINSETIFRSGSAELDEAFFPLLDQIASLTEQFDDDVIVAGHTDDVPIATGQFPSNWELSGARAGSMIRHLVSVSREPAERFMLIGYAETVPVESNSTPKGRAANRRVDILLKNSSREGGI